MANPNYDTHGFGTFVDRTDVLILDVETTGFGNKAEVIQLGVIDTRGNIRMDCICIPEEPIWPMAQEVYKIDGERIKNEGRPFPEVYAEIRPILEGAEIVWARNMPFDRKMLQQSCERHGLSMPDLQWYCAMKEYASVRGSGNSHVKLETATDMEGVEVHTPAHSAVGDCQRVLGVMRACTGS